MPLSPGSKRTRYLCSYERIRGCWIVLRVESISPNLFLLISYLYLLFNDKKMQVHEATLTSCGGSRSIFRRVYKRLEAIRQAFEISREDIRPCGGWPGKENVLAASRYLSCSPLISDTAGYHPLLQHSRTYCPYVKSWRTMKSGRGLLKWRRSSPIVFDDPAFPYFSPSVSGFPLVDLLNTSMPVGVRP